MTFVPIIERELLVRSRRGATYWTRFAVAVFGGLICLMQINLSSAVGGVATAGNAAFQALVVAAFSLCCSACLMTADAISSERREGTLGLLFLTHVRGHDVLLGKLASAALAGLCAVLAFLPVLMIPVLSGGVTGGEALRKGLVLLDTLFVNLAVGLWASVRGEVWQVSIRKAALLMLGILIVPLLYGVLTRDLPPWSHTVAAFSPITGMLAAGDLSYRTSQGDYWGSLVLVQLLGWALLWRASVLLRHSLREPSAKTADRSPSPALADPEPAPRRRQKPLTDQTEPIEWLMSRQRGLWVAVWVGVLFAVSYRSLYPFLLRLISPGAAIQFVLWPASLILNVGKAALFAWVASRFFVEGRHTGELEVLLTTPRGAATIVSAQWEVLKRVFRWPIVVLVLVNLAQTAPLLWRWYVGYGGPAAPWQLHAAVSLGIGSVVICVGVLALGRVGMWFGLTARNQTTAIVWTVGVVTVAPQLVAWILSVVVFGLSRFIRNSGSPWLIYLFSSWLPSLVMVVFCLWLIHRAKRLLSGDLRHAELQPFGLTKSAGGFWRDGVAALRRARHWTPS